MSLSPLSLLSLLSSLSSSVCYRHRYFPAEIASMFEYIYKKLNCTKLQCREPSRSGNSGEIDDRMRRGCIRKDLNRVTYLYHSSEPFLAPRDGTEMGFVSWYPILLHVPIFAVVAHGDIERFPIDTRQPDTGLEFVGTQDPYLIIYIACNESEEHQSKRVQMLFPRENSIRCIYRVGGPHSPKDGSLSSHTESQPHVSPIPKESPPLSPLGITPASPIVMDQRSGRVPLGDTYKNPSNISSSPLIYT